MATLVSTASARSTLVNDVPRVTFLMVIVTRRPATATAACSVSPGRTPIRALRPTSGTSSYQVEYRARPEPVQSASVPICSSAREVRAYPPRPTHVDE